MNLVFLQIGGQNERIEMENEKEVEEEKVLGKPTEETPPRAAMEDSSPDLGETDSSEQEILEESEEPVKVADYSLFSKKDFVDLAHSISQDGNFRKVDSVLREIKPLYDEIREKEKAKAIERYTKDNGAVDGFEFKGDEWDRAFDATLKLIRDKRNQFYKSQEEQKSENLRKRLEILEKLRSLVDADDSEHSFHHFKQLQQDWKTIGPVAVGQVKTLWANYSALVDRFYDHRSIYFELKELDRKKNLEAKAELCEKAERLLTVASMKEAIHELNELHHEFKHIGPVPKDDKEIVWQRFKAASDTLYTRRDAYVSGLQLSLAKNLEEKLKLAEELAVFSTFQSDRIKEWNGKTQEILEIQKKWEAIGAVPRARAKEINKKFWSSFKAFFNGKNSFFKRLDEERDKNLQLKSEIIKKALALQDSSDWDKTANELKELQLQWKEAGPVPERFREKIFQEFKQACDHFFEQRRGQFEKADREQEENLREKEIICAELERLTAEKAGSLDLLTELQNKFNSLGFVPKRAISGMKNRFNEAVDKFIASLEITSDERDKALLEVQLGNLKNDPDADRKLYQKEQTIRKRITKAENDIAVLRNNLEFFGRSKNAEKFKDEFNAKIGIASEHLLQLKNQLKMLRTVSL
ncbi:MAG TPA: DUF349 domain-containing protein [Cyclobacteriaceae bacterium]|nr:DUF349 domain-containing protein [Cyclobacteriaceae bacterium]